MHKLTIILRWLVLTPFISPPFLWYYAFHIEPNWIQVTKIEIKSPLFNEKLEKIKMIQISDLHIHKEGIREKRLINIINKIQPDLIFITGDIIGDKNSWPVCLKVLRQLKANKGIFAILGDTEDYLIRYNKAVSDLRNIGITVLNHNNVRMKFDNGAVLWIAGISEKYGALARYGEPEYIDNTFEGIPDNVPVLLLIHKPELAEHKRIEKYAPSLILAGDTHGGQFGIDFIRKMSDYANHSKYMEGMFLVNGIPLYVNRGIGTIRLNMRFLCRPEITKIILKKRE